MSNLNKINESHRKRMAYIYIRQSTLKQVSEHLESQDLQYQLRQRAESMGWRAGQIHCIDEDLGKSAINSSERTGFQSLMADIALGKVGILFVTDVSRLARNCADWYHLLDLAALVDVLLCDGGGVYNPRHYDDRLLLGFKGIFSEAQWYTMRQHLQAARLNKAQRGELALRLPVGYQRLPTGEVRFYPDSQVQSAIQLVFAHFRRLQSARAVLRQLIADGVQLPFQSQNALGEWTVAWRAPSYPTLYQILKLPAYAGAYCYGKSQSEHLPGSQEKAVRKPQSRQQWLVLLHDTWPAYISWQEYEQNQQLLHDNAAATPFRKNAERQTTLPKGAPGLGRALLQGIAYCARCGRKLHVRYQEKPAYVCVAEKMTHDAPRCLFVPHAHVDDALAAAFLQAIQPAALEVALATLNEVESQRQALRNQWQQRIARARHEVEVARLRYEKVEPSLRLVAVELERSWEEKLLALQQLQEDWQQMQQEQLRPLAVEDEALIRNLATDLPALWAAPTTTPAERKRLLRCLIADVTLDRTHPPDAKPQVGETAAMTLVHIRWQSGATTTLSIPSPRCGHPTNPTLIARVTQLAQSLADDKIAEVLNAEGLLSQWHLPNYPDFVPGSPVTYWNIARVRHFRNRHKIPTAVPFLKRSLGPRADGLIAAREAAAMLNVSTGVLLDWFRRGLLPGHQHRPGTPVWIDLNEGNRHLFDGSAQWQPAMLALDAAQQRFNLDDDSLRSAIQQCLFTPFRLFRQQQYRWFLLPSESLPADSQHL